MELNIRGTSFLPTKTQKIFCFKYIIFNIIFCMAIIKIIKLYLVFFFNYLSNLFSFQGIGLVDSTFGTLTTPIGFIGLGTC